jgi:indolepyruvate ferredoxin oxidoreductase alpha subunit
MGASIGQASGFYHAFKLSDTHKDIVATIGDSTFFHSGTAPLMDAVVQDSRFVLVILDNSTTAMTGNQPTPACGIDVCGLTSPKLSLENAVKGCGVGFCRVGNPYDLPEFTGLLKEAGSYAREQGVAVVIARYPCLVNKQTDFKRERVAVRVSESCNGCAYCIKQFECPAIEFNKETKKAFINPASCSECGVCVHVCPQHAIKEVGGDE